MLAGTEFGAGAVGVQAGGDEPGFAEMMIEGDEAVVKTDVAIWEFEVIDGAARQARLDEILEIVTPIAKAAAQRKRQVDFLQQFVARHQLLQRLPGIAKARPARALHLAPRAERAKNQQRTRRDERIARLG